MQRYMYQLLQTKAYWFWNFMRNKVHKSEEKLKLEHLITPCIQHKILPYYNLTFDI